MASVSTIEVLATGDIDRIVAFAEALPVTISNRDSTTPAGEAVTITEFAVEGVLKARRLKSLSGSEVISRARTEPAMESDSDEAQGSRETGATCSETHPITQEFITGDCATQEEVDAELSALLYLDTQMYALNDAAEAELFSYCSTVQGMMDTACQDSDLAQTLEDGGESVSNTAFAGCGVEKIVYRSSWLGYIGTSIVMLGVITTSAPALIVVGTAVLVASTAGLVLGSQGALSNCIAAQ